MKIVFIMTPIEMTNLVVVVSVGVILNWDMIWHKDKGGLIMPNGKYNCKYCGTTEGTTKICTNCYDKIRLIRKLLKMVRDTYEKYGKGESK